jgi:hypothetical protein
MPFAVFKNTDVRTSGIRLSKEDRQGVGKQRDVIEQPDL